MTARSRPTPGVAGANISGSTEPLVKIMTTWQRITSRFGSKPDMLGFTADAAPSADEWLTAFTTNFMQHADAAHGTLALISGLRFYTADFVAALAALPPVETRQPPLMGTIPRAIYTATGPIIVAVYQAAIRAQAPRAAVQAAFMQAMPGLVRHYKR